MSAFFLTMMACLVVTLASRESLRVARLSAGLGASASLHVAAWAAAIATSAAAAWAGTLVAPSLTGQAKQMFLALAIALAAIEIVALRAGPAPREPTRSLGAILLVLLASLLTDGARFLVLALSVQTAQPELAAAGGAVGSGVALSAAIALGPQWEAKKPRRISVWTIAALLLLAALVIGLSARGIVG